MPNTEEVSHDLLLTIVIAIFILYSTGLGGPPVVPSSPIVIP
ncbi:MAG: hypothetical protein PHT62_02370 [Desulfotomaculaceae bacterium]|nr:hypothetical protein [Desulfotomaculaceae bacterium]